MGKVGEERMRREWVGQQGRATAERAGVGRRRKREDKKFMGSWGGGVCRSYFSLHICVENKGKNKREEERVTQGAGTLVLLPPCWNKRFVCTSFIPLFPSAFLRGSPRDASVFVGGISNDKYFAFRGMLSCWWRREGAHASTGSQGAGGVPRDTLCKTSWSRAHSSGGAEPRPSRWRGRTQPTQRHSNKSQGRRPDQ